MKKWSQSREAYNETLRKRMVLSFGDFKVEGQVREEVLKAIRACDEAKIAQIKVPGYDKGETLAVLKRHGVYPYAVEQIVKRRSMIETELSAMFPQSELDAVKGEIFGALKVEKAGVNLDRLSPVQKVMLRDSGLTDYLDLIV